MQTCFGEKALTAQIAEIGRTALAACFFRRIKERQRGRTLIDQQVEGDHHFKILKCFNFIVA